MVDTWKYVGVVRVDPEHSTEMGTLGCFMQVRWREDEEKGAGAQTATRDIFGTHDAWPPTVVD